MGELVSATALFEVEVRQIGDTKSTALHVRDKRKKQASFLIPSLILPGINYRGKINWDAHTCADIKSLSDDKQKDLEE